MAKAHYFHATLYRFITPRSRAEIVSQFNSTIHDVSARCWYNIDKDVFELTCPQAVAYAADECLGSAIDKYIEEELQAAEHEDRCAQVERFPNNFLDDLPPDLDNADAFEDASVLPPKLPLTTKLRTVFVMNTEANQRTHVRLLQSRDMPSAVIGRVLVDLSDRKSERTFGHGYRACAVRWDVARNEYVLNGSRGQQVAGSGTVQESCLLALDYWPSLQGTQDHHQPIDNSGTEGNDLRRWKFKGQKPTFTQWLDGLGETEPDERQDEAELPNDAKRMLASSKTTYDTMRIGRIRVPQGASLLPSLDEEEGELSHNSDDGSEGEAVDFSQLLDSAGRRQELGCSPCSPSELDSDSHSEHVNFSDLLAIDTKGPEAKQGELSLSRQISRLVVPIERPSAHEHDSTQTRSQMATGGSGPAATNENLTAKGTELMATSSSSAIIDSMGLRGHATIQAKWDLDHFDPNRKQVRSRPAASANGLRRRRRIQESNGGDSQNPAGVSDVNNCPREEPFQHDNGERWVTAIAPRADPSSVDLVDTYFNPSTQPTKLPPGLQPIHPEKFTQPQQMASHYGNAEEVSVGKDDPPLIDFDGRDTPLARPSDFRLSFSSESLTPTRRTQAHASGEGVVERLAEQGGPPLLRYTMRQKAGKKKKGQPASKPSQSHVQLPLPDPMLPPQGRKRKGAKHMSAAPQLGSGDKQEISRYETGQPRAIESIPIGTNTGIEMLELEKPTLASPEDREIRVTRLRYFLRAAKLSSSGNSLQIVVQFGKAYLDFPGQKLPNSTYPAELMEELNSISLVPEVTFFSRLTQCHLDAFHIRALAPINMLKTPPVTSYHYDVHIRSTEGGLHQLRSRLNGGTYDATLPDSLLEIVDTADAYLLFPCRSFDGHVSMRTFTESNDTFTTDCKVFLASARSFDISPGQVIADPSFQAQAPTNLRIEKIYARTCFTYRLTHNGSLEVSRVRELKVERLLDNVAGSNMKATMSRDDTSAEWWEAQICFGPNIDAEELLAVTESFVKGMDGVGFKNQGPREVETSTEVLEEKEIVVPFW